RLAVLDEGDGGGLGEEEGQGEGGGHQAPRRRDRGAGGHDSRAAAVALQISTGGRLVGVVGSDSVSLAARRPICVGWVSWPCSASCWPVGRRSSRPVAC